MPVLDEGGHYRAVREKPNNHFKCITELDISKLKMPLLKQVPRISQIVARVGATNWSDPGIKQSDVFMG